MGQCPQIKPLQIGNLNYEGEVNLITERKQRNEVLRERQPYPWVCLELSTLRAGPRKSIRGETSMILSIQALI
jgi:hypothetical protein